MNKRQRKEKFKKKYGFNPKLKEMYKPMETEEVRRFIKRAEEHNVEERLINEARNLLGL